MRGSVLVGALSAWVVWLAAAPKSAQAQGARTPAVWYRASAACPTGPEFLAKIADGHERPRLAEAGDHIDFVVTLLSAGGETVGRLERQTNGGTVAIRELRDATCAQVANALALSLSLALEPEPSGSDSPAPTSPPVSEATGAAPAASAAPPTSAAPPPPPAPPLAMLAPPLVARSTSHTPALSRPPTGRAFGADAGLLTGLGTQTMLRASAFVDFTRMTRQLALRIALVGALGTSPTPFGSVSRSLLAGRGEVCQWRWGGTRFGLSPCAGFELGGTNASLGGHSDHALWAAPGLGLRAALTLAPFFRVEAGFGGLLPLVRGHIFHAAQPLYQDEIIAFQATLGILIGQF